MRISKQRIFKFPTNPTTYMIASMFGIAVSALEAQSLRKMIDAIRSVMRAMSAVARP
jgi:hypothetical protein